MDRDVTFRLFIPQERQIKLICDILVNDSKSSACLNDEQRSMLANFNHKGLDVPQQKGKRYIFIYIYRERFLCCAYGE